MNIAILTPNRLQSILLINNLVASGYAPKLVLFHVKKSKPSKVKAFKQALRALLFFWRIDQKIRRIKIRNERLAQAIITGFAQKKGLQRTLSEGIPTIEIASVNSQQTIDALRANQIDILFIWGVPIIKPEILGAVRQQVINAHTSLLPHYRGSQVEFWMFYYRDFKYAGVTFHQVDSGVDTGDIIMQIQADDTDFSCPEVLRAHNSTRVIAHLPKVLQAIDFGNHTPLAQKNLAATTHKTFTFRDITMKHIVEVYCADRR